MKTNLKLFLVFAAWIYAVPLFSQKRITEGIITYDIFVQTGHTNPTIADMFDGATAVVYLKGYLCRFERVSALGVESTITNSRSGEVNVLKEYGEQKYLITLTPENWKDANKKYKDIIFTYLDEYKEIAGYKCQKAVGKQPDGSEINVFFTRELIADNRDFEYAYKTLPGLAMEYETNIGSLKVMYRVSKISFNIVPASKFELPKSGYRVMTYEESKSVSGNQRP